MTDLPLLRAPPFPRRTATVSRHPSAAVRPPDVSLERVRAARVGGAFWAVPARLESPPSVIVRPASEAEIRTLATEFAGGQVLWAVPLPLQSFATQLSRKEGGAWYGDVDPWSVLDAGRLLVAHGDDEWVAIAAIIGAPVRLLSDGKHGRRGDSAAELAERARALLGQVEYLDPFNGEAASIEQVIDQLADWRRIIEENRAIAVAFGMAWWKRREIATFLWVPERAISFARRASSAIRQAERAGGGIAIWPSRAAAISRVAPDRMPPLVRVEDGFVRSVGLGSNLVPPSSVVVDQRGIHFDPSAPSDLEHILATHAFPESLVTRAAALRRTIVSAQISKYAAAESAPPPPRQTGRRLVLVPAQVEDDMSVVAGGGGLSSNLEFLRRVRAMEPDAEIWFRPHPDVDAGHRKGAVPDDKVLRLADRIVREPSMAVLLDVVDAVHVITSLTGFEALLRGRQVTCHGTPFYAGWGLTTDLGDVPSRRGRDLSLDQLVAGVLILYPRYLDPVTHLPCPPETLIARMAAHRMPNWLDWLLPVRRWQGRFMAKLR